MDDDDVHDLNKTHKKNNGEDGDGTRKKKQKNKNSILKPVVGISGLGDRKKEGHANGGKESNDNQTTKKYTTHKKNNQHHGVLDTWRNKTLRDDKHKKNIPTSGIAVDGQTDEDAPQTTTTTSSSASSESPFNGDVPTSLQVVRSIKTTPVKKKIVFTSPKHTRRTKPTMELSDLGKRSILGLMSPGNINPTHKCTAGGLFWAPGLIFSFFFFVSFLHLFLYLSFPPSFSFCQNQNRHSIFIVFHSKRWFHW